MRETWADMTKRIIADVEAIAPIEPGSRFDQMRRMFIKDDGSLQDPFPPGHPDLPIAREAMRDIIQLNFIHEQLALEDAYSDFNRRFKVMLKDDCLPQECGPDTPGRDTQCEMYVEAMCEKAGLSPVFKNRPDIICEFAGEKLAIEVKRLKSFGKLHDRICKAAEQIQAGGVPGFIAMDFSVAFNVENVAIPPIPDAKMWEAFHLRDRWFLDQHLDRLIEWTSGARVLGLIMIDHHLRQDPADGWQPLTRTVFVGLVRYNARHAEKSLAFWTQFRTGMATPAENPIDGGVIWDPRFGAIRPFR